MQGIWPIDFNISECMTVRDKLDGQVFKALFIDLWYIFSHKNILCSLPPYIFTTFF